MTDGIGKNRLPTLTQAGYIAANRLFDIINGLLPGSTLGVAAWQRWATDYNEAIFILL
jgi:hypothetical protein